MKRPALTLLLPLLAATLLSACKEEPKPQASAPTDPNLVTPPPALMQQIVLSPAGRAPVADVLRVAGRIDFDESRVARIGATVTGRVTELHAALGDTVHPGDTLATLHSTELGNAQLAYLKAKAQAELMARGVERAQLLLSADVIGSAELQKRESELSVALAEQRAAADQLRVLGFTPKAMEQAMQQGRASGGITSVSSVAATLSGTVVERKVAKGQVVQPADALYTVADLSRVWVVAQVPETEIANVRRGQTVDIEIPALGKATVTGQLIHVGEILNPETRTVTVRTEIDNADRRLKPAMLATMLIMAQPTERLVVPATAVVREENADHVFVEAGEGSFRLTRVTLGPVQEGRRAVLSGLSEGARIVADGAFHLNNERKRKELEGS